jgi:hypothetical protein
MDFEWAKEVNLEVQKACRYVHFDFRRGKPIDKIMSVLHQEYSYWRNL